MLGLDRNTQSALDHIRTALEANCAALLALETIRAEASDVTAIQREVQQAIESLREAIAELRASHDQEPSIMLAHGFVLPAAAERSPAARRSGQAKPPRI